MRYNGYCYGNRALIASTFRPKLNLVETTKVCLLVVTPYFYSSCCRKLAFRQLRSCLFYGKLKLHVSLGITPPADLTALTSQVYVVPEVSPVRLNVLVADICCVTKKPPSL